MFLNHYTAFVEKYMQGRPATLIGEYGETISFSGLDWQAAESPLPMIIHQTREIVFGSDNTPETGESYKLKKAINAGLNTALTRSVQANDDGSHSSVVIANCTNISSEPITIGEVGLRKGFLVAYSSTKYVLLDRTPLPTPLTIQPGEVGRIVYTITMA